MVAERLTLDMEGAFKALRNHARNHNRKLIDIAQDVIAGVMSPGDLDPVQRPNG
jgi:AmiR/NasT family two-component response regulator